MPTVSAARHRQGNIVGEKPSGSTVRLEARIPSDLKILIETAALLAGHTSVTDYLVQTMRESASRTIEQSRQSRLESEQSEVFVRSLIDPASPTPALRAAMVKYRARVR